MRKGAVLVAALVALATAPAAATAPKRAPGLATRVAQVASGLCVDVLSRKVTLPTSIDAEDAFFAKYGLKTGIPDAGMNALGRDVSLVAQATLAHGETSDGAFMIALGGRAGPTCRVVIYKASTEGQFLEATYAAMQSPAMNWRELPVAVQPTVARKLSLFKRDASRQPYLANLLAPTTPGPIVMIANVAAIPPQVVLPQGF